MSHYRIALDAMGGDNAPEAIVEGALRALERYPDTEVLLAGPKERIEVLLSGADGERRSRVEILNAMQVIGMDEAPMMAVRQKRDASIVVAMNAVREGAAGAMVSAGSTGAILAGGIFKVGRIRGVERPAIGVVLPGIKRNTLLMDSGANVDCQPKYLLQFGLMGSAYMRGVEGIEEPRVGLVNIGAEAEKGNKLVKETYELMSAQSLFRFAGNCEAREIFTGDFDVAVTDGFDGNLILKHTEGLAKALFGMMKDEIKRAPLPVQFGGALVKPVLSKIRSKLDYNVVGGAPLLGVNGAVVKAHGSSGAQAIENAIAQARRMLKGNVVEYIREGLAGMSDQ